MGFSRGQTEIVKVFTSRALNVSALNSVNEGFPIGEAWRRMILVLYCNLTHGTGTTPTADGLLLFLKSLSLKTSRGWIPYLNVPGRALFRLDQARLNSLPVLDTFAAATAIYKAVINLWFSDPMMMRPDDFLLDSSMFNKAQLDLNVGSLADLLGTVGTDTAVFTYDLYIERVHGKYPAKFRPKEYPEVGCPSPVNPASATELNFERADNLAYKRILVQAANSVVSGQPFSGTPADTTIAAMGIDSDAGEIFNKIPWLPLNSIMKGDLEQETAVPGYAMFDFCKDKSKQSAILGGQYSRLRAIWDNGTLSTSQVSAVYDGFRKIT